MTAVEPRDKHDICQPLDAYNLDARIRTVEMTQDAQRSALLAEFGRLARGTGLAAHTLRQHAPNLYRLLQLIQPDMDTESTLRDLLEHLVGSEQVVPIGTAMGAGPPGRDWAAIIAMSLNLDGELHVLGARQKQFELPESIARWFNCHSTTSSRFRTVVTGEAYGVLADLVLERAATHEPSRPATRSSIKSVRTYKALLLRQVRAIIASHGLDDKDWALAISSQYFLCLLARELGLTGRVDYQNLLNRFLASFTYRVDDSLVLNPEHILVTPEETQRILNAMLKEDGEDPYFARSSRTRAENVDIESLHLNYLYGLTLAIAATGESSVIRTVRELAMAHLFDAVKSGRVLDIEGGWQPYRIPWLTARILISLAEVSPEIINRHDGAGDIIGHAVASLSTRLNQFTLTWRSGVGEWVTEWESTGLSLEALLRWPNHCETELLRSVLAGVAKRRAEWLVAPDLATEVGANTTLAAVILASVLLEATSKDGLAEVIDEDARLSLWRFLADAMDAVQESLNPQTRQFCTVPQALFYTARAAMGGRSG